MYDWKQDEELLIMLSDTATAPTIPEPKFDTQYKFVILTNSGVKVKKFVPEWALSIVSKILDNDKSVRNYFYELQYKPQ